MLEDNAQVFGHIQPCFDAFSFLRFTAPLCARVAFCPRDSTRPRFGTTRKPVHALAARIFSNFPLFQLFLINKPEESKTRTIPHVDLEFFFIMWLSRLRGLLLLLAVASLYSSCVIKVQAFDDEFDDIYADQQSVLLADPEITELVDEFSQVPVTDFVERPITRHKRSILRG